MSLVDLAMIFSDVSLQPVSLADREVVARLHNCVIALAQHRMMLYDTSILYTFEASLKYQVSSTGTSVSPSVSVCVFCVIIFSLLALNGLCVFWCCQVRSVCHWVSSACQHICFVSLSFVSLCVNKLIA